MEKFNPGAFDRKRKQEEELLEKLASEIAFKFKIDKTKAIFYIRDETIQSTDNLRKSIEFKSKLSFKQTDKLLAMIKGAREVVKNFSRLEIKVLRSNLELDENEDDFLGISNEILEKTFGRTILEKAKNPENISDHLLGFSLGMSNSIIATVDFLYQVGSGIIKAPYDLYLVFLGKGVVESWKKI